MRESKTSDQEVFESIPWEELRDLGDTARRRRIWILVGGTALLAVIVFSVARTFSAPDPLLPPPETTGAAPDPVTAPPPSPTAAPTQPASELPELAREADLMADVDLPAVDPPTPPPFPGEWQAASYAEWFVLEFFTLDGSDSSPDRWGGLGDDSFRESTDALSHVEWVRTLRIASLGDGRWKTQVALRRVVSTDGVGYTRLPTQAVEVVVNMNSGVPEVVDLPRFIPLPTAEPGQWWLGEPRESPPEAVITTAWEEMTRSGADSTDGEPRISRAGEVWRVEWAVVDEAGIPWPVSLWVGPDGSPVPAGG